MLPLNSFAGIKCICALRVSTNHVQGSESNAEAASSETERKEIEEGMWQDGGTSDSFCDGNTISKATVWLATRLLHPRSSLFRWEQDVPASRSAAFVPLSIRMWISLFLRWLGEFSVDRQSNMRLPGEKYLKMASCVTLHFPTSAYAPSHNAKKCYSPLKPHSYASPNKSTQSSLPKGTASGKPHNFRR